MTEITLGYADILVAGNGGVLRQVNALKRRLVSKDAHHHDSMEGHVSGAIAEWAVCQHVGIPWSPTVGITHASQVSGDVLNIEVRSTPLEHGCLIVHDYSFDDRPYLLVLAHRSPTFVLSGWMMGADAKQPRFWRANVPRPAFFVPQRELLPVDTLLPSGVTA